jgi:hypothetical protein
MYKANRVGNNRLIIQTEILAGKIISGAIPANGKTQRATESLTIIFPRKMEGASVTQK